MNLYKIAQTINVEEKKYYDDLQIILVLCNQKSHN